MVIGTPVLGLPPHLAPTPTPLITLSPQITAIYKVAVPGKMRAVAIQMSQAAQIMFQLLDSNDNPVDLTQYGFPSSGQDTVHEVICAFSESVQYNNSAIAEVQGTVVSPTQGQIVFTVPTRVAAIPAVYIIEVGAFQCLPNTALGNCSLILSNTAYLLVQPGLFTTSGVQCQTPSAMPTLQELRIALRDSPEGNRLTSAYENDVADCCDALTRAVHYWNTSTPYLPQFTFNTQTFPWKQYWSEGAVSYLLEYAAVWFRRNKLQYNAAGVAVDDLNKDDDYDKSIAARKQLWQTWVRTRKAALNMEACFGSLGSTYAWSV